MTRNLNKTEYNRAKNIPIVQYCHKLQPETPIRNHLLDTLPKLSTQINKILQLQTPQNNLNLQLSNSLKIIHQLEDQLQLLSSHKMEIQEQFYELRSQKQQMSLQLSKNKQSICEMERQRDRKQFMIRSNYERQIQRYTLIVNEMQRKIHALNDENGRVKEAASKSKQQMQEYYLKIIKQNEHQAQQMQDMSAKSNKKFENDIGKVHSQNIVFQQKVLQLELLNQKQLTDLQNKLQNSLMDLKNIKQQSHSKIHNLQTMCKTLQHQNSQLQCQSVRLSSQLKQTTSSHTKQYENLLKQAKLQQQHFHQKYTCASQQIATITNKYQQCDRKLGQKDRQYNNINYQLQKIKAELSAQRDQLLILSQQHSSKLQQLQQQHTTNISNAKKQAIDEYKYILHKQQQQYKSQIITAHEQQLRQYKLSSLNKINILQLQLTNIQHQHTLLIQQYTKQQNKCRQLVTDIQHMQQIKRQMKQYYQNSNKQYLQKSRVCGIKQQQMFMKNVTDIRQQYQQEIGQMKACCQSQRKMYNEKQGQFRKDKRELEDKIRKLIEQGHDDKVGFIQQIHTMDATIQRLKAQKQNIASQLTVIQQYCHTVEQQKIKANNQLAQGSSQTNKIQSQLKQLTDKLLAYQQQAHSSQSQVMSLQQQKAAKMNELQSAKQLLQKAQLQQQNKQKQYIGRIDRLQKQCRRLQQQKLNMRKQLIQNNDQNLKSNLNKIREQFEVFNEKTIRQSELKVEQLQSKIDTLTQSNKLLLAEVDKITSQYTQQQQCTTTKMSKLQIKIKEMQGNNKGFQAQALTLQKQIQAQRKQIEQANIVIKNKNKQCQQLLQKQQKNKKQQSQSQYLLKFEIDKLNTQKLRLGKSNESLIQRQKWMQKQVVEMETALKNRQQQIYQINEESSRQNLKMRQQLKMLNLTLQEQINKYYQQITSVRQQKLEQQSKHSHKIVELQKIFIQKIKIQKQRQDSLAQQNQRVHKLLTALSQQKQNLQAQLSSHNSEREQRNQQIHRTHSLLQQQINKYEQRLQTVSEQIIASTKQLQTDRCQYQQLSIRYQTLQRQCMKLRKSRQLLQQQVIKLEDARQKDQQNIRVIYEQADRKMEQSKQQLTQFYDKQIWKNKQRIQQLIEHHSAVCWSKQEQKQQQIKLINEKYQQKELEYQDQISCKQQRITEITIQLQDVLQKFQITQNQLLCIKNKWTRMYSDIGSFDTELNTHLKTPSQYKTHGKRTTQTIHQYQYDCEQAASINKKQQSTHIKNVSSTHQQLLSGKYNNSNCENIAGKSGANANAAVINNVRGMQSQKLPTDRNITKLLRDSDSDVINSRTFNQSQYRSEEYSESEVGKSEHQLEFRNKKMGSTNKQQNYQHHRQSESSIMFVCATEAKSINLSNNKSNGKSIMQNNSNTNIKIKNSIDNSDGNKSIGNSSHGNSSHGSQ